VDEGFAQQVYAFSGADTAQDPAVLSDEYFVAARKLAFQRAHWPVIGLRIS
jgi:hypothetical protein